MSDGCFNSGLRRANLGKRLLRSKGEFFAELFACKVLSTVLGLWPALSFLNILPSDMSLVSKDLLIKFDNPSPQGLYKRLENNKKSVWTNLDGLFSPYLSIILPTNNFHNTRSLVLAGWLSESLRNNFLSLKKQKLSLESSNPT